MNLPQSRTLQKVYRAEAIHHHLQAMERKRVVCFTCGNAAAKLRGFGLDVLEVGPQGGLQTDRWWTPTEIAAAFPDRFDATSGHLPVWLMAEIGQLVLGNLRGALDYNTVYQVPSGSGETLCCLALAEPRLKLVACYDNNQPETTYNRRAPLNGLVKALAARVYVD